MRVPRCRIGGAHGSGRQIFVSTASRRRVFFRGSDPANSAVILTLADPRRQRFAARRPPATCRLVPAGENSLRYRRCGRRSSVCSPEPLHIPHPPRRNPSFPLCTRLRRNGLRPGPDVISSGSAPDPYLLRRRRWRARCNRIRSGPAARRNCVHSAVPRFQIPFAFCAPRNTR